MFVQGTLKTNALVPVVAATLIVNNYDCARIGYLPFRGPGFYTVETQDHCTEVNRFTRERSRVALQY